MCPSNTSPSDQFMPERRVRVPFYPKYSEVRYLLRVLAGRSPKQMTRMKAEIGASAKSLQNPRGLENPDEWISETLQGDSQKLACAIWTESGKTLNPVDTAGSWSLIRKYNLMTADSSGLLQLTPSGMDFSEQSPGNTETHIDKCEGLLEILALVTGNTPTKSKDIFDEWSDYLTRHRSPMRAEVAKRVNLQKRLNNLIDRGFVKRRHTLYSVTREGLAYLKRSIDELRQVQTLLMKRETSVREQLRKVLHEMVRRRSSN